MDDYPLYKQGTPLNWTTKAILNCGDNMIQQYYKGDRKMTYLILAQICLTIGTPDWVVAVCYVYFGMDCLTDLIALIGKIFYDKD